MGQTQAMEEQFTSSSLRSASENCESSTHPESSIATNRSISPNQEQERDEPLAGQDVHLTSEAETESLVDFVLSVDCGINDLTKRQIVQSYLAEYEERLKFFAAEVKRLTKRKSATWDKLVQLQMSAKTSEKELHLIKSSIERETKQLRQVIDERNTQRRQRSLLDQRIKKIEQLSEALQQME